MCRRDGHQFIGDGFENVNRWMNEYFAVEGSNHRHQRHHQEGVQEVVCQFGRVSRSRDIPADCGHVLSAIEPDPECWLSASIALLRRGS